MHAGSGGSATPGQVAGVLAGGVERVRQLGAARPERDVVRPCPPGASRAPCPTRRLRARRPSWLLTIARSSGILPPPHALCSPARDGPMRASFRLARVSCASCVDRRLGRCVLAERGVQARGPHQRPVEPHPAPQHHELRPGAVLPADDDPQRAAQAGARRRRRRALLPAALLPAGARQRRPLGAVRRLRLRVHEPLAEGDVHERRRRSSTTRTSSAPTTTRSTRTSTRAPPLRPTFS